MHDAAERGGRLDAVLIAKVVWRRFVASTDLTRPRQDRDAAYGPSDAAAKVADKLLLLREGRLPPRVSPEVEAPKMPKAHPADEARTRLDIVLEGACAEAEAWLLAGTGQAPQIGVKATVGLGKSSAARRHVLDLSKRLAASGLPSRVLILTPSLAQNLGIGALFTAVSLVRSFVLRRAFEALRR